MFSMNIPTTTQRQSWKDQEGMLKFDPPVWEQRLCMALNIIKLPEFLPHVKKVVDLGCGELKFLQWLRQIESISHMVGVDVDEHAMLSNKYKVSPLIADFLKQRDIAVRIELYTGSMDVSAECLRDADVVTALEVIEHVYPDVLENVPYNVFGFMQPKLAIFSTPNADFNVHFGTMQHSNGFRNADHKFEWTREQFQNWATNITERFPNYCVTFFGVGSAPYGYENRGPVSQFALFVRRDIRNLPLLSELMVEPSIKDATFTQLYTTEFPQRIDERSLEEKIIDEANYSLNQYKYRQLFHDEERAIYLVPFEKILLAVEEYTTSAITLRNLLQEKGYVIENGCIVVKEENHRRFSSYSMGSDSECDMYEDEDEDQEEFADNTYYDYSDDRNAQIVDREEECWDSDSQ